MDYTLEKFLDEEGIGGVMDIKESKYRKDARSAYKLRGRTYRAEKYLESWCEPGDSLPYEDLVSCIAWIMEKEESNEN